MELLMRHLSSSRLWGTFLAAAALLSLTGPVYAAGLKVYAGLALRPALPELVKQYQSRTGVPVEVVTGAPAELIDQMAKAKSGDVFIPGSVAMMKAAAKRGVVAADAGGTIAYLAPTIIVAKGNPKHIRSLNDLAAPGVRVAVRSESAGPEDPCLGAMTADMLKAAHLTEKVKGNTVASVDECNKLAAEVRQGRADATIAWTFFAIRVPDALEAVPLPADLAPPRPLPAAVTAYASDPKAAQAFVDFLRSPAAQQVFEKQGYVPLAKVKARAMRGQLPNSLP
jgi:molybdate transport system substrate-binding protein